MSYTPLTNQGPLNAHYLKRIEETVYGALVIHPRLTVVRIDLRIPDCLGYSDDTLDRDTPLFFANTGPNLIKRFIASLKAQIEAQRYIRATQGKRNYLCELQYIWVREQSQEHKAHYHMALMLNKDCFFLLGNYNTTGTLAWMIKKAWASAMGLEVNDFYNLVHFPEHPVYTLNHNAPHQEFMAQLYPLLTRLSYFAKERTKVHGAGHRNFGCSNPKK